MYSSIIMETGVWSLPNSLPDNLMYIRGDIRVSPTFHTNTGMTYSYFEEGDYVLNYDMGAWDMMYG